jgi:ribosome biogenesis GTPase
VIEAGSDVVVANLDLVAVVEPLRPAPDLARVGRLLELARGCGASPIIVLTGADAVVDPGRRRARVATRFPDVPIITTKPVIVYGQTLALVGTVGAGTAHLVQSLVGAAVMRRRGRHREPRGLILLPDGGAVFDASDDWLEGTGGQSLERARKIVIPRG